MNDLIRLVCERAAYRFNGDSGGTFNSACFAGEWASVTATRGILPRPQDVHLN